MDKIGNHSARVKLLPDNLINQIAAGEVIERPASVVKELLDNSLDAGTTQITIDVEQGGVGLIRVKDNGSGIHHDDLALALTRHATSKIRNLGDLRQLVSMGFRGEALPSVASISRTIIMSKFIEDDHAWMIKSEGRTNHSQVEPVSHLQGTTVEVRDLFFNVPARRKYLRTERTEFYQIQQLVRHFAISHPEIAVRLTHNGRQVLNVIMMAENAERDDSKRVSDICGKKFIQNAIKIDSQVESLYLSGWIGKPEVARTMSDSQFFCLNGRCIRDKRVNHAIQQAFQDKLPVGRFAVYALYLKIDPTMVDVNVHPAKTEVRFREGRTVHDFIYSTLNRSMLEVLPDQQRSLAEVPEVAVSSYTSRPVNRSKFSNRSYSSIKDIGGDYFPDLSLIRTKDKTYSNLADKTDRIGNVLIVRKEDELLLIDIEKTLIVLYRKRLQNELEAESVLSKPLLFPHRIELDQNSIDLIRKNTKLLQKSGIVFHQNNVWQLREVPAVISINNPDNFVLELLKVIKHNKNDLKENVIELLTNFSGDLLDVETLLDQFNTLAIGDQKKLTRKLSEKDLQNLIVGQR